MSFKMKLWQVAGDKITDIDKTVLDNEKRLEDWVAADSSILGMELLLIGRQVTTSYRGHIDLLGIDSDANLVILELKRDKTPRDIVAQTLDYATWVKDLSYQQADAIATGYLSKSLKDAFAEHFGFAIPQTINVSHSMVILASELDDSSERIVQYLNTEHEVNINVIFFTFFGTKAGEFLGRAWLMDPQEVQERAAPSRKQAPWSGYYFVNVGEGNCRNWDDCRKYGFLSAGHGRPYGRAIQKLKEGDPVFAYMKGLGYVGYGHVTEPAVMARDFVVKSDGKELLKHSLKQPNMDKTSTIEISPSG